MSWRPLLEGDDAARAERLVTRLREASWLQTDATGLEDTLGFALVDLERRPDRDAARATVERVLAIDYDKLALADGLAGAVFVSEVGARVGGYDDDLAEGFEGLVLEHLPRLSSGEFMYGVAGVLLTALERRHRRAGPALIEQLIARLEALAEPRGVGVGWASYGGAEQIGLSHGISSIACLLADAASLGFDRARPLAEAGFTWLERLQSPPGSRSVFPPEPAWSQPMFAFCHGDAGMAGPLGRAAQVIAAAKPTANATRDAALSWARAGFEGSFDRINACHGSLGASQLLARLVGVSGDDDLRERCRATLLRTMAHLESTPFDQCLFDFPREYAPTPTANLFDGASGVALVLQSATSAFDPMWDRLLLMRGLLGT